jgi:hypothetical protein
MRIRNAFLSERTFECELQRASNRVYVRTMLTFNSQYQFSSRPLKLVNTWNRSPFWNALSREFRCRWRHLSCKLRPEIENRITFTLKERIFLKYRLVLSLSSGDINTLLKIFCYMCTGSWMLALSWTMFPFYVFRWPYLLSNI